MESQNQSKQPNEQKKRKGRPVLSFLLVAVMAVELWLAAYKYPGFLIDEPRPPKTDVIESTKKPIVPESTKESSPGKTDEGDKKTYTEDDLPVLWEDLPPDSEVGVELVKTEGGTMVNSLGMEVTADNSPGNPALIDVLITEDMIQKVKPAALAISQEHSKVKSSGVTVDFGEWNILEEDVLNIREMGNTDCTTLEGTLQLYDFSLESGRHEFPTGVEITVPRTAGECCSQIVTFNEETKEWEPLPFRVSDDGKTITYWKTHFSTDAELILKNIVWMSNEGFFKISSPPTKNYNYNNLADKMYLDRDALRKYLETDDGFVDKLLNDGGLSTDALVNEYYDMLNNYIGLSDFGFGVKELTLSGGVPQWFCRSLSCVAFALTLGKVAYQVSQNRDKYIAMKESAVDIIALTAAGWALKYPTTANSIIALVCFSLPAIFSGASEAWKERDYEYKVYKDYLAQGVPVSVGNKTYILKSNGEGWDNAISAACMSVLRAGKNPAECSDALLDVYNQYLTFFPNLPYEAKNEYAQDNQYRLRYRKILYGDVYRDQDDYPGWKQWTEPSESKMKGWIEDFQSDIYKKTKSIIDSEVKLLVDACEMKLVREIENVILPYMNRMLEITVTDLSLPSDLYFYDSPYAYGSRVTDENDFSITYEAYDLSGSKLGITFPDMTEIKFQPFPLQNTYRDFNLYVRKGTNTLIRMRYYHYMQIGCPKKIEFKAREIYDRYGKQVNPKVEKPLTIPQTDSPYIQVNITLNSNEELYELLSSSMDEQRIVASNDMPQMMLLDLMGHAELKKSSSGNFVLDFKPDGVVEYDKETTRKYLGWDEDDPNYHSTKIKYHMTNKSAVTGKAGSDGTEGKIKADIFAEGTGEVWEHMEYIVPGEQEDLKYTAGIQQTINLYIYGTGKARSSITQVPGKEGEYELIELTLDLEARIQATNGKVLSYSGPESVNPSVDDGDVTVAYDDLTLTFISKAPMPATVSSDK